MASDHKGKKGEKSKTRKRRVGNIIYKADIGSVNIKPALNVLVLVVTLHKHWEQVYQMNLI